MERLTSDLYSRCRSILLACDEFQSNESLRAVFVSEGLGAYRDLLPEANRRDQRVDLCLDFLLHRRWKGEAVLILFLEALGDRYPEGDDLRTALDELAPDVRASLKHPTAQSSQQESPLQVQAPADKSPGSKSGEAPILQEEFRYDAFISYSHKDSDWVYSVLLPRLEQAGLRVCIDYRDFEIGVPSLVNMENAVDLSRKTLLILTPHWIASEWTKFESLMIQTQDPTNLGHLLLPLMVQHCTLPNRLRIFTYLDLTKPTEFERQMQRLLSAIHSSPLNQTSGEPTAVEKPSQLQFVNTYALLIGIATYHHMPKLSRSTIDVQDIHEVLLQSGYAPSNVRILLDNNATKQNINNELEWLAHSAKVNSTVAIFFSGHGIQQVGGFWSGEYLCPIEAMPGNGIGTLIKSEEIITAIQAIRAARLVVFFDACHAGGVSEIRSSDVSIRAGLSEATYDSIAQGSGRVIIASCLPNEESHELSTMRNSLFAHFLLEGLRGAAAEPDGAIYISRLFSHICQELNRYNLQHPFQKSVTQDFVIALVAVVVSLQKYYNFVTLQRTALTEALELFKGTEDIWPGQCSQLLNFITTISKSTQQLYEQVDKTAELPTHIRIHQLSPSILEELHKIVKLISDRLEPYVKDFAPVCRETSTQATRLRTKVAEHLQSLQNGLDAFTKLLEEHALLHKIQSQNDSSDVDMYSTSSTAITEQDTTIQTERPSRQRIKATTTSQTVRDVNKVSRTRSRKPTESTQQYDFTKVDHIKLFEAMEAVYDDQDLPVLCFKLNVKYGDVQGKDIKNTIINLINLSRKENWYPKLVGQVLVERPHLASGLGVPK